MCGIAGYVNLNNEASSHILLKNMTDAIAHRGPDGEGQYVEENIALGHRRLAIIDLSAAGHQPMATQDGRYVITYNGEIYNFQQIKTELQSIGYQFYSQTDSEVALYSYSEWGSDCINKFNGVFAFVVWDKIKKELFIARDRYGVKPLYYTFQDNTFIFGSEQKAILTHPAVKKEIDLEGLLEYFTFQNFFTDKTLLKNIKLFPAGYYGKLDTTKQISYIKMTQYWDYDFCEPDIKLSEQEYIEELDRLFKQAINRQLISDVPVGTYLSGGMDSASITAIAAKQLPYMKTFTCGFDLHSASGLELSFDEREKAEYMSYLFKTEHYEMVLKAGDMERILPTLAGHLEEPRVGQSYPNYYTAQLASKFVKVVLSGAGGDELFAGYPWRYYRAVNNSSFDDYIDKYYTFWQRLIPNKLVKEVFKPVWADMKHVWTKDIFRDVFKHRSDKLTTPEEYINHSLYFEAKTFLHGLLVIEDKISMAHGLETRVPFLDNDLVDFAMKVPVNLKLKNLAEVARIDENETRKASRYFEKNKDGKVILRKVMEKYVPQNITEGIKQGFSAPDASWFKGESIEYVKSKLYNNNALIYNYMDKQTVQALLDEHMSGKQNRRLFIWSLLNFEKWSSLYL